MKCQRMETALVAYLDGRATAAERREVETHLAECAACRARAEEFRGVWGALDELPEIEPSPDFDARLYQRIEAEPARSGLWAWLAPAPRVALAFAALLLLAVWISWQAPAPTDLPLASGEQSEEEFRMIRDLQVLENYEILAELEVLSELPPSEPEKRETM